VTVPGKKKWIKKTIAEIRHVYNTGVAGLSLTFFLSSPHPSFFVTFLAEETFARGPKCWCVAVASSVSGLKLLVYQALSY
jgi:hypothetical protein